MSDGMRVLSRKRIVKPSTVAWLVPVAFACGLALPEHAELHVGVGEALGCSGSVSTAPSVSGFTYVKPRLDQTPNSNVVPVATDGFFTIDAYATFLSIPAEEGVKVVVQDEQGATVVGETKLLRSSEGPFRGYLFGWSASSPLPIGTKLKASVTAMPAASTAAAENIGGEYELDVVGGPTTLPPAAFTFTW